MLIPPHPSGPRFPGSIRPHLREPLSRESRRKRFFIFAALLILGLVFSGVSYYEMSNWNPEPTRAWAMPMFICGCLLLVAGVIAFVMAFPELFDTGENKTQERNRR